MERQSLNDPFGSDTRGYEITPEDKKLSYLPILLKLRDHPCVVVGGGMAATKKVEALLSADARLTVISPQVTEVIARLAAAGHLQLVSRSYTRGDLRGFYLAYAATGVSAVDEQIARDAESEHNIDERGGRPVARQFYEPANCSTRRSDYCHFNEWEKPRLCPAHEEKVGASDRP
jgi:hypothetical protein